MVNDSFPQSRRRQSGIFCLGFITSTALCIAMATVEDSRTVLGMWIALDCVEVLIYPIAALTIKWVSSCIPFCSMYLSLSFSLSLSLSLSLSFFLSFFLSPWPCQCVSRGASVD
jgi:hypothetical protein